MHFVETSRLSLNAKDLWLEGVVQASTRMQDPLEETFECALLCAPVGCHDTSWMPVRCTGVIMNSFKLYVC